LHLLSAELFFLGLAMGNTIDTNDRSDYDQTRKTLRKKVLLHTMPRESGMVGTDEMRIREVTSESAGEEILLACHARLRYRPMACRSQKSGMNHHAN
jgi:hypothetical protein